MLKNRIQIVLVCPETTHRFGTTTHVADLGNAMMSLIYEGFYVNNFLG